MLEEEIQRPKRGRGRPRKNPGDPVQHYKTKKNPEGVTLVEDMKYYIPFLPKRGGADICEENLDLYFEAMYERQLMWKRKVLDKAPGPWTTDETFLQFKTFANVYRELDDSAQWCIRHIIMDQALDTRNVVWKVLVYRLFNKAATFELTSHVWPNGIPDYEKYEDERNRFLKFMNVLKELDAKPFTNAYTVASSFAPGETWVNAFAGVLMPYIHENIDFIMDACLIAECPTDIIDALKEIPGISTFMSNEIYQDLMYITRFTEHKIFQFVENDWVNIGPGSSLGLRVIFPNLITKSQQRQGIYKLKDMAPSKLAEIAEKHGEPMPYAKWDEAENCYTTVPDCNLTLCQIEDWLCEWSRYWRMHLKTSGRIDEYEKTLCQEAAKAEEQQSESADVKAEELLEVTETKARELLEVTEIEEREINDLM